MDSGGFAPRRGIVNALLAAVLFGASAPLAKVLLEGVPPQVLAGLLYLGSGIGLGVYWAIHRRTGRPPAEAPITRHDLPWLAGAIATGGVIAPVLLMMGLGRTPASTAALLLNLEGAFTALLAWVVFRENVDRRIVLGMAAIVAGGVLLSWGGGNVTMTGLSGPLLVAGACFGWAVDNNLTQKVSAGDPVEIAALKGLVSGGVNLAAGLALGGALPILPRLFGALLVGLLGYGVSLVLYVLALRALGTARTGAYFSVAPFIGAVIGLAIFGERLTVVLVGAGCLMALGLWLHLRERHLHEHTHEPLTHTHRHRHDEHHQHAHGPGDPPGEPHTHAHAHARLVHMHPHYPDIHHRHTH